MPSTDAGSPTKTTAMDLPDATYSEIQKHHVTALELHNGLWFFQRDIKNVYLKNYEYK